MYKERSRCTKSTRQNLILDSLGPIPSLAPSDSMLYVVPSMLYFRTNKEIPRKVPGVVVRLYNVQRYTYVVRRTCVLSR